MATSQPCRANASAMPRQMPVPPPVISATRFFEQVGLKHAVMILATAARPAPPLVCSPSAGGGSVTSAGVRDSRTTGASVSTVPDLRVLLRHQDLARADLRMLERLADRPHAAARDVLRLKARGQFLDGELLKHRLDRLP